MCGMPFEGEEGVGYSTLGSLRGIRKMEGEGTPKGISVPGQHSLPPLLAEEQRLDVITKWAKSMCR